MNSKSILNFSGGLSAKGRQQGAGAFFGNDFFQGLHVDRFNIYAVRGLRVSHNGGWIGIDQNDLKPFFFQCLAGLIIIDAMMQNFVIQDPRQLTFFGL